MWLRLICSNKFVADLITSPDKFGSKTKSAICLIPEQIPQTYKRYWDLKVSKLVTCSCQGTGCSDLGDNRWLLMDLFIIIKRNISNQYFHIPLFWSTVQEFYLLPFHFFFSPFLFPFWVRRDRIPSFPIWLWFPSIFFNGNSTQGSLRMNELKQRNKLLKQMQWVSRRANWMLFYEQYRRSDQMIQ